MFFEFLVVIVYILFVLCQFVDGYEEVMVSGEIVGDIFLVIGCEYLVFYLWLICVDGSLVLGLVIYFGLISVCEFQGLVMLVQMEELVSIVLIGEFFGELVVVQKG